MRIAVFLLLAAVAFGQDGLYPNRWVYVSRNLTQDRHVEEIQAIARTAAEHGLTGLVLAAGLDRLDLQPAAYVSRVREVKAICDEYSLELVPSIFSSGYGGSILAHNRSLAEGLPVRRALFVVRGGEARLAADPPVALTNGGFEEHADHRARGFQLQDRPGEVSFTDTEVFHGGSASLRLENFGNFPFGHGRVMQEVAVRPYRSYRVTVWVKTENLAPAGAFRVQVLALDGRALAPWDPLMPATTGWRRVAFGFNSAGQERVRLYAGVWGGRSGRFWVDDWQIDEVGLVNVVRRPGTPLTVEGEGSGLVYEEGRDYARVADPRLNFESDHDGPPITILPGSRIADGERLRVSYYHGVSINAGQVTICMSEPEVYQIWEQQARLIHDLLAPKKYLLSMDEIRAGGSCQACKRREMSMAQILGDCLTRQFQMLRGVNPKAEVWTWSDMLDPNHNARPDYYLVDGDYTGSWEYVPKELGIVCWYYAKRRESLKHFSGLGSRTLAGAYYDGDTLENPKGWLEALREMPGASGIMYTTWQNKYGLLPAFGDLVSGRNLQPRPPRSRR